MRDGGRGAHLVEMGFNVEAMRTLWGDLIKRDWEGRLWIDGKVIWFSFKAIFSVSLPKHTQKKWKEERELWWFRFLCSSVFVYASFFFLTWTQRGVRESSRKASTERGRRAENESGGRDTRHKKEIDLKRTTFFTHFTCLPFPFSSWRLQIVS